MLWVIGSMFLGVHQYSKRYTMMNELYGLDDLRSGNMDRNRDVPFEACSRVFQSWHEIDQVMRVGFETFGMP